MPVINYQSGNPSSIPNLEQDSNGINNQDYLRILRLLREQANLPYANIELDNLQYQIDLINATSLITLTDPVEVFT